MGTLKEQPARNGYHVSKNDAKQLINEINEVASDYGIDFKEAFDVYKLLEERRTNTLKYVNSDVFDEQLAGFGELIEKAIDAYRSAKERIE